MWRTIESLSLALVAVMLMSAPAAAVGTNLAVRLFNTGCRVTDTYIQGCFFANTKGPGHAVNEAQPLKTGEACGWNVLSLFTAGDVRITTAMRDGGISRISSVDYKAFELIPGFYGIYSRYCTVVTGE